MTNEGLQQQDWIPVWCTNTLIDDAKQRQSKIFIKKVQQLKPTCTVTMTGIIHENYKKSLQNYKNF